MAEITLSAAVRANLLNLASTQSLINQTQNRLATGLKIASPIDDAKLYFEAKGLSDRASDFRQLRDGIDQAVSQVKVALDAVDAIDSLVSQLKGLAISAKSATGSELTSITTQYNDLRAQIDLLASDAQYQGLNLVNDTAASLTVSFGTLTSSLLTIAAQDLNASSGLLITSAGTGAASFSVAGNIDSAIAELDAAITTLRGAASALGSNVGLLQTRLDFTKSYVNALEGGAVKLTLADINEEGANLVALQTRQQLGISALAFAGQSEQSVLSLFR